MTKKNEMTYYNISTYVAIAVSVLVLLLTFIRLYFGVDFTDEAFYITMQYRFAMGASPFIDEVNMAQAASLIFLPFIKLYYFLIGSPEGIILFSRRLYFVYTLFISSIIFFYFKSFIKWQVALLISLTFVVLIPYGVPNISYNTLGCGFFTLGCISGITTIINQKKSKYYVLPGLFHGLAVLAYPTMIIPVLFFMGSMFVLSAGRIKNTIFYGLGALLIIGIYLPVFINAGFDKLIGIYSSSNAIQRGSELNKLIDCLMTFWSMYPYKIIVILTLIAGYFGIKKRLVVVSALLLFLPLFPLLILLKSTVSASLVFLSYYAFLAPYLFLFIRDVKNVKQVFWVLWLPSFVAGLTFAWSSSNGYHAAGLGFFLGSLVTAYFMYVLLERMRVEKNPESISLNRAVLIAPVIVLLSLTFFQYTSVYRDNPFPELNTRVVSGPYRGMFTTPEKNKYLTTISEDLRRVCNPKLKVLFYDRFPAGYLLTPMIPATNACWLFPVKDKPNFDRQTTIDYLLRNNIEPDIVVKMKKVLYTTEESNVLVYPPNDSLNNWVENGEYREILSNDNYSIFQKAN